MKYTEGSAVIAADTDRVQNWYDGFLNAEPWINDALCAETGGDFFPEKGGSTLPAKAVCARCDVAAQCLEYALRTGEREGVWGGLSPNQRARMLRGAA